MKKIVLILLYIFLTIFTYAQNDTLFIKEFKNNILKDSLNVINSNMSPDGQGKFPNFVSYFSLTSSFKEGENGKIELKYVNKKWLAMGLIVDQKIGKNDKSATPYNLDGLTSGTTVALSLGKIIWKNVEVTTRDFNAFQKAKEKYCIKYKPVNCRGVMLSEVASLGADEINVKLKKPLIINFKGGFTKTDFNYVTDSTTLKENSSTFLTPSLSVSFIRPLGKLMINGYSALTYSYLEYYNEGDNLSLLTPFGTTSNFISKSVTFGEPRKKIDNLLNLEFRKNFPFKKSSKSEILAASLSATYGLNSDNLEISIPIYFIHGADKDEKPAGLQGGIKFSYFTSTKNGEFMTMRDGMNIQLIISMPFNALQKLN